MQKDALVTNEPAETTRKLVKKKKTETCEDGVECGCRTKVIE